MILGIDGYAGVGKDTTADILVKEGFTKVSFADHLRESAMQATGLSLGTFLDRSIKDAPFSSKYKIKEGIIVKFCDYVGFSDKTEAVLSKYKDYEVESPRHLLQILGTDIGRDLLDPLIWINGYKNKIKDLDRVVSPDARFSNERECIHEMGGFVIWISRPGYENGGNHKSEQDKWPLDKYDLQIDNTSLFDLKRGIRMWWSLVGHKL